MTGYQSKKAAALDKLEQWDTPSEAFNEWWDSDYDDSTNPYEINTFAYWAWAGWQAALAQPAQWPVCPECKAGVLYECVACSSNNYPPQQYANPMAWAVCDKRGGSKSLHWPEQHSPDGDATMFDAIPLVPQRTWVGLTDEEHCNVWYKESLDWMEYGKAIEAKLKEKNND